MAEMQIAVGRRREAENGWRHGTSLRHRPSSGRSVLRSACITDTDYWMPAFAGMTASMTHFLHTQADLDAGLAQLIAADPRLKPVAEKAGAFCLAPARGGLCRALRHRLRPAAFDRQRRGDPRPAVRRLRSVSSRRGAQRAHRQAQAARPLGAEDQVDPRNRQGRRQRQDRSRPRSATWMPMPRTPRSPRCTASGRGAPTSISCSASAIPTPFRPAISPCRKSARIAFGLRKRPSPKALTKLAEAWRPWRGVAAHLLWAYYHAVKKRDVVPIQPGAAVKKKPKKKAKKKTTKRKRNG